MAIEPFKINVNKPPETPVHTHLYLNLLMLLNSHFYTYFFDYSNLLADPEVHRSQMSFST